MAGRQIKSYIFLGLPFSLFLNLANAATVFPIATNASLVEISGGIASSGTNYLSSLISGTNVCVQLFSTNGTLIGSLTTMGNTQGSATFSGSNDTGKEFPSVAFGATNYLEVWYDTSATKGYGRIVSPNGALSGPVLSFASAAANTNIVPEAVASDHTNFLVVLEDYTKNFYGQFVTAGGVLSGSPFLIASEQGGGTGKSAAVTFGATNFLVVWQSGGNLTNLTYGALVSENGVVNGPIQIGQTSSVDNSLVNAAFDGTNYLPVWMWHSGPETEGNNTNWEIFGRLISPTGTFTGNELELVTDPGDDVIPSVAFDGIDYLLSWGYGANVITNTNVRFQFLNRAASAVSPEFTLFTTQSTNAPFIAVNGLIFDGTRYVTAATLGSANFSSGEVYGGFLSRVPTLTANNYTGTRFLGTLTGTPGFNYAIEVTTNLTLPNWTPIVTNSPTNGTFTFTDTNATNKSRFYRAEMQ